MKRFIHIPKNGGSAVAAWLETNNIPFVLGKGKVLSKGRWKHKKIHETAKFFKDNFPKFAVVRNPYTRFLSYYSYNLKHCKELGWNYSFEEFVRNSQEELPIDRMKAGNKWWLQKDYVFDDNGTLIVEKILRFENLEQDLQEYFGISSPMEKINTSSEILEKNLYTDDLRDIVYKHFEDDFKLLGYEK